MEQLKDLPNVCAFCGSELLYSTYSYTVEPTFEEEYEGDFHG